MTLLLDHIKHQETIESASARNRLKVSSSSWQRMRLRAWSEVQEVLLKTSIPARCQCHAGGGIDQFAKAGEVLRSLYLARHFIEGGTGQSRGIGTTRCFRPSCSGSSRQDIQWTRFGLFDGRPRSDWRKSVTMKSIAVAAGRTGPPWRPDHRLGPAVLGQGRLATVDDWIAAIPQHVLAGTPGYVSGMPVRDCLGSSRCTSCFEQVFAQFVAQNDQAGGPVDVGECCALYPFSGGAATVGCVDREVSCASSRRHLVSLALRSRPRSLRLWRAHSCGGSRAARQKLVGQGHCPYRSAYGIGRPATRSLTGVVSGVDGQFGGGAQWPGTTLGRTSTPGAAPSLKILYCLSEALLASIEARADDCRRSVQEGLTCRAGRHPSLGWVAGCTRHSQQFVCR